MAGQPNTPGNPSGTPVDRESVIALKIVEILTGNGKLLEYMKKLNKEVQKSQKGINKYNKDIEKTHKGFNQWTKAVNHLGQSIGGLYKSLKIVSNTTIGLTTLAGSMVAMLVRSNSEFLQLAIASKNVDQSISSLKKTYSDYTKTVNIATMSMQGFASVVAAFKGKSSLSRFIFETDENFQKLFTSIRAGLNDTLSNDAADELFNNFVNSIDPAILQKALSQFDFNSTEFAMFIQGVGGGEAYNAYFKLSSALNNVADSTNENIRAMIQWNKTWNQLTTVYKNAQTAILTSLGKHLPPILEKIQNGIAHIPPLIEKITAAIGRVNWLEIFNKIEYWVSKIWNKFVELPGPVQAATAAMLLPGVGSAITRVAGATLSLGANLAATVVNMVIFAKTMQSIKAASITAQAAISGADISAATAAGGGFLALSGAIAALALAAHEFHSMWINLDWDKNRGFWDNLTTAFASENNLGSKMTDFEFKMRGIDPDSINDRENAKITGSDLMKKTNEQLAKKHKVSIDVITNWRSAGGDLLDYLKNNNIDHKDPNRNALVQAVQAKTKNLISSLPEQAKKISAMLTKDFDTAINEFNQQMKQFSISKTGFGNVSGTMSQIETLMETTGSNFRIGSKTIGQTADNLIKRSLTTMIDMKQQLQIAAIKAENVMKFAKTDSARNLAAAQLLQITEELQNVQSNIAQVADLSTKQLNVDLGLQEQKTQLLQSQLDISKGLFGAPLMSIAATKKVLDSLVQEQNNLEQQLAKIKELRQTPGQEDNADLARRELDLQNKIQQKLLERVNITKELRDGYLDAVTAQAFGAGKFEKLIITQEKNIAQGLRSGAVKNSYLMGSIDRASKASPVRFSAEGVGSMTGANGQPMTQQQMLEENSKRIDTVKDPLTRSMMESSQRLVESVNSANKANGKGLADNTEEIRRNNDLLSKYLERGTRLAGEGGIKGTPGGDTLIGESARRELDPLQNTRTKGPKLNTNKAGQGQNAKQIKQVARAFQDGIDMLANMANIIDELQGRAPLPVMKDKPGRGTALT